jgi:hypothetical protein
VIIEDSEPLARFKSDKILDEINRSQIKKYAIPENKLLNNIKRS